MKNFNINVYDSWDETYHEADLIGLLKDRLNLNILDILTFDKVMNIFETGDLSRIKISKT